jgi:hypothetical protein
MYRGMIDSIAHREPKLRSMATGILTWIVCVYRPLWVAELEVALQPEFPDFVNLAETVEELCGNFAQINYGKVTPCHETARVFLLQKTADLPVSINGVSGHEKAAMRCIDFFQTFRDGRKHLRLYRTHITLGLAPTLFCHLKATRS